MTIFGTLRGFGRPLAAACTIAAIAVAPAAAHHKPDHNPPGHSKAKGAKGHAVGRQGGPPPWAPAHGYRGKRVTYETPGGIRHATVDDILQVPVSGAGNCNRDVIGAILGGVAGAAAGSRFGKGDGRKLATIGGAIIGTLVGGSIGRAMDEADQNCIGQALERAQTGQPVVWRNPDAGRTYEVTPTRTYESAGGRYCREYQTVIVIDGRRQEAHGTACRQPDGTWQKS